MDIPSSVMGIQKDRQALKKWFIKNRREFPWREKATPYQVWVSEVMLQQTRASVVTQYYQRWMQKFPTLSALAKGTKQEVIKLWEGLGYYSRARNLHEGAKFILEQFHGEIPKDPKKLKLIKGIGPYTIGAIRSFAFQEKEAAVDGNVTRVISRYFALREEIGKAKTKQDIKAKTELFLEGETPHIIMEGLIELGAILCKPIPNCQECPLYQSCISRKWGLTEKIPNKIKREKTVIKRRLVMVIRKQDRYMIFQKQEKIMKDLYQFPYFDFTAKISIAKIKHWAKHHLSLSLDSLIPLSPLSQFYTKYKVQLYPYLIEVSDQDLPKNYEWVTLSELKSLPFCSGHRKILRQL